MKFNIVKDKMIQNKSVVKDICIAMAGDYVYHGEPLSLNSDIFSQAIKNFNSESQALPVFKGHADVNGNSTGEEVDSFGWILGLTMDEYDNLWAKVEFNEEMTDSIKDGRFKYCSIYMREETDRQTGDEIGNRLVSLAMTNEPYLPNLPAISLSNKKNQIQTNIYSKELSHMANGKTLNNKKILSMADQTLPEAEAAAEQMDKLQENKTSDVIEGEFDANKALMEVLPEGMTPEDFFKSLLDCYAKGMEAEMEVEVPAVLAKEETVTETETEKETPEEQKTDTEEVKKKESEVVASSMMSLSQAKATILSLQKQLDEHKNSVLLSTINDAIKMGCTQLSAHKKNLLELGKVNKELFDFQIEQAKKNPEVKLGRLSKADSMQGNTILSQIESTIKEDEKLIYESAMKYLAKRK